MRTVGTLLFTQLKVEETSQTAQQQGDINPNKSKNKPCPCGSGKKYKECCYQRDLAAQQAAEQEQQQPQQEANLEPTQLSNKERWALAREQRKNNKKK